MAKKMKESDDAKRCRLHDYDKFVSKEEMAKFREDYANEFRTILDKRGNRIYDEEVIHFQAYEYLTDDDLAMYIYCGQTPAGLCDIMAM